MIQTTTAPVKRPRLKHLLFGASDSTYIQFLRYTVVGGVAFAVDFGLLFGFTRFAGLFYLVSAAISFTAGLAVNYLLSRVWVFNRRTLSNPTVEFAVFAVIGVAGLGLNELGMWILASKAGMNYLAAKIATAALVYIWNFGARKLSLFQ